MDPIVLANTIVAPEHLEELVRQLERVAKLPTTASIAEVGVYKGGTARLLCLHAYDAHVHLFDTFTGLPQESEHDNFHHKGDFADTSPEHVARVLDGMKNVTIHVGEFPLDYARTMAHEQFKLVHIDVDLYASVRDCLAFFEERMVRGGVIVLDDYTTPTCLGAKRAVDEFMETHPILPLITGPRCQARIVGF